MGEMGANRDGCRYGAKWNSRVLMNDDECLGRWW
jgi:hypothetical protein